MLAFHKGPYIHVMKVNYFNGMDKRAIGKGPDKLNTQTKYHWASMDFSFAKITIMARRKIYTAIESFRVLLNKIPIYQIMS